MDGGSSRFVYILIIYMPEEQRAWQFNESTKYYIWVKRHTWNKNLLELKHVALTHRQRWRIKRTSVTASGFTANRHQVGYASGTLNKSNDSGRVHPGWVPSSSQGQHGTTPNRSLSHSHLRPFASPLNVCGNHTDIGRRCKLHAKKGP